MTDFYRYGLGYYSASKITIGLLRESINNHPKEFEKAISFYHRQSIIKLMGDKYKRPLISDHSGIIQDWYQRKSFYLVVTRKIDGILFSPRLKGDVVECFKTLGPIYKYLNKHTLILPQ